MSKRHSLMLVSSIVLACAASTAFASIGNLSAFSIGPVFLQPNSNNLKYAVFVAGNQPYNQSWHNQQIDPGYSAGLQTGLLYAFANSDYNASLDWLYFTSNDSASKQANRTLDTATIQFVAPPYDVGPAVFGIKHASSSVNNKFNSVGLNFGKWIGLNPHFQARIFGGLNFLNLNQTITTVFNDYAGALPVATQAYGLPADPSFSFQTVNQSKYLGAGPDLGFNVKYEASNGFGVAGALTMMLTAGTMSTSDTFTSTSMRLSALGINPSTQAITAPSSVQVVPGMDSKLGVMYSHKLSNVVNVAIELGYRFSYYWDVISSINPDTLVQPGLTFAIPEFSTGTMAINSTTSGSSGFSLQGPYFNITFDLV